MLLFGDFLVNFLTYFGKFLSNFGKFLINFGKIVIAENGIGLKSRPHVVRMTP